MTQLKVIKEKEVLNEENGNKVNGKSNKHDGGKDIPFARFAITNIINTCNSYNNSPMGNSDKIVPLKLVDKFLQRELFLKPENFREFLCDNLDEIYKRQINCAKKDEKAIKLSKKDHKNAEKIIDTILSCGDKATMKLFLLYIYFFFCRDFCKRTDGKVFNINEDNARFINYILSKMLENRTKGKEIEIEKKADQYIEIIKNDHARQIKLDGFKDFISPDKDNSKGNQKGTNDSITNFATTSSQNKTPQGYTFIENKDSAMCSVKKQLDFNDCDSELDEKVNKDSSPSLNNTSEKPDVDNNGKNNVFVKSVFGMDIQTVVDDDDALFENMPESNNPLNNNVSYKPKNNNNNNNQLDLNEYVNSEKQSTNFLSKPTENDEEICPFTNKPYKYNVDDADTDVKKSTINNI